MISQKAKLSAVRNALAKVLAACHGAQAAQKYHDELKKQVEVIAASLPEPSANGKIGKSDFHESATEKIVQMFSEKLGEPSDSEFQPKQTHLVGPPIGLHFRAKNPSADNPKIGEPIRFALRGNFSLLPVDPTWEELIYMGTAVEGWEISEALQINLMDFGLSWEDEHNKNSRLPDNIIELWGLLHFLIFECGLDSDYTENHPRRCMARLIYVRLRIALISYEQLLGSLRRVPHLISED